MAVKYIDLLTSFTDSQSLATSSVKHYHQILTVFLTRLGGGKFTRTAVVEYITELKERGKGKNNEKTLKPRTIKNRLDVLNSFARFLWEIDHMTKKELDLINGYSRKVKFSPSPDDRRALTPNEVTNGLNVLSNPIHRMLFWTGCNYGLRRKEFIKLKLADVDLDKAILSIRTSKGGKSREIPILGKQVPVWKRWLKIREAYSLDHEYVFFTDRGKADTKALERYFNKISERIFCERNGMKKIPYTKIGSFDRITSHTLRYTYAVRCWRGKMDLLVLSKMLGHSSLVTTQIYLRVEDTEIATTYRQQATSIF